MEHNMVASSRIYDNVSFKELGMLLQIPCQQVHDGVQEHVKRVGVRRVCPTSALCSILRLLYVWC